MLLEIKYYRNFYYCPHTLKSFCIDQVVEKPESRSDSVLFTKVFSKYALKENNVAIASFNYTFVFSELVVIGNIYDNTYPDVIFSFKQYLIKYTLLAMGNNCCRLKKEEQQIEKNVLFFNQ